MSSTVTSCSLFRVSPRRPQRSPLFPYTTLFRSASCSSWRGPRSSSSWPCARSRGDAGDEDARTQGRSEEHTSELQSHSELVCRLLLEKKNWIALTVLRRPVPDQEPASWPCRATI